MKQKIELGDRVKDVVNGREGICTGITSWLTGCDTLAIEPDLKSDGTASDAFHIDMNRAALVKAQAVVLDIEHAQPEQVGGPHDHGQPSKAVSR